MYNNSKLFPRNYCELLSTSDGITVTSKWKLSQSTSKVFLNTELSPLVLMSTFGTQKGIERATFKCSRPETF
jgi:hypothetical protein